MKEKTILIDGHSIMHRAFYGVPDLSNSAGLHTNAVYGFLNIMFKLMDEEQPAYMAVAFDMHAPTFRHKMYDAYKGTRKPMPEELREQMPVIRQVLDAMGILVLELEGYEADDILGTMAKRAAALGKDVCIVSGDRDLLQIADESIMIRIPKTKAGRTQIEDYSPERVKEEYHVSPQGFIELKALMGDTADNIPGVPKVGEKTAMALMEEYGSIEGIYENIESISKKAIKESLIANRDLCDLSLKLATINTDAPVECDLESARLGDLFNEQTFELFKKLEFRNLLGRFEEDKKKKTLAWDMAVIRSEDEAKKAFEELAGADKAAFIRLPENCLAACREGMSYLFVPEELLPLIAMTQASGVIDAAFLKESMDGLLRAHAEKDQKLITFDVKNTYDLFEKKQALCQGTDICESFTDIKLMAYLINPLKSEYTIEDVAGEYCSLMIEDMKKTYSKAGFVKTLSDMPSEMEGYVRNLIFTVFSAAKPPEARIEQTGQKDLYYNIEMPLTFVLYSMEKEGVKVDRERLREYGEALGKRIDVLENGIYETVGERFNLNSPKQLGQILFEKLQLKGGKKTKTGYSTAADVLEKLAPENPVVRDILEYRALAKLKSTYADGLDQFIADDGRIHTKFNQMITATGRLSSTDPNLQNIPMRTELGRQIRKVFLPKDGFVFTDADYSQIELRILAHMSGDMQLIEAYRQSEDIHAITASKVFGVPLEEVTPLQRRNAKAVNFGIVYGISSFGLSQDLSISRQEAAEYISQYFATYPGIKKFLDEAVEGAKETGFSRTLYGRLRPIPELKNSNFMQRQFGERVAMNAPIQGTAADIMKIAMIKVFRALDEQKLKSRMILQVHDELLIETAEDEKEKVLAILRDNMKGAASLEVELETDIHTGPSWYEAK
ncbi:MAG: DNA polymerase I [Lachnospiraceae bacterium]|nr:DNA polymerase I [Lachnospiraceae bacterium]